MSLPAPEGGGRLDQVQIGNLDFLILQECCCRVLGCAIGFVEDSFDFHSSFLRFDDCFRNRLGCERVGLDTDDALGVIDLPNDGIRATTVGREVDLDGFDCPRWRSGGTKGQQEGAY